MNELLASIVQGTVRTVTPMLVGFVVALLARANFQWTPSPEVFLAVSAGLSSLFYAGVRYAEDKWSDKFGWLLGAKGAPTYGTADANAV